MQNFECLQLVLTTGMLANIMLRYVRNIMHHNYLLQNDKYFYLKDNLTAQKALQNIGQKQGLKKIILDHL